MTIHPMVADLGRPKTPSVSISRLPTVSTSLFSPEPPSAASRDFARKPSNRGWNQEQQRQAFLYHLTKWSLEHDSSPHFHGKISLAPQPVWSEEVLELGKSVRCILANDSFTVARKSIVVRLFPPQGNNRHMGKLSQGQRRQDSIEPSGTGLINSEHHVGDLDHSKYLACPQCIDGKYRNGITQGYYKLVIRCGAGWMSARDYFNKLHLSNVRARKVCRRRCPHDKTIDPTFAERSITSGPPSVSKDTVTIQPLFHPFTRLPPEIQELILLTAAGMFGNYNMCHGTHLPTHSNTSDTERPSRPAISLSTMLRISPHINTTLAPYIYHATDFHFGVTGFTNFLWQSSHRRSELRRLTFHFGKLALLHCIRWLAPDHVFELFEPPVVTNPRSLQYFWRCQIQDLSREVTLLTLTLDVSSIPVQDLAMVTRIMRESFGGVERIRFVETDKSGKVTVLERNDLRLAAVGEGRTWRELSRAFFEKYRRYQYFTKFALFNQDMKQLEKYMDENKEAFDQ